MKIARAVPLLILGFALIWYLALVVRYPTHGAIGTDPATYVQMALDLAQRGSVVHEFPLLTKLFEQGLSWDAFITPGYHIVRETGFVAPNFAFGFPLLLAIGYRVFGENALYWTTPLLGALSLIATFALANQLFQNVSPTRRDWIGALAVLLLATSPKQIQLALVPMSDVPAQLFCVCAMWCALAIARRDRFPKPVTSWVYAALGGLCLGIAYLIRHSAIVVIIPLVLVAMRWGNTRREKFFLILVALFVFAITIFPDVVYRANVLGSPFAVESPESAQVNVYDAPRQFLQMLGALFSVTGFGPIVMLAPFAWWILWREKNKFIAIGFVSWILAFMLFHAPLFLTGVFENNLRYLLPAYPAFVLSIAWSAIWILERALRAIGNAHSRFSMRAFLFYVSALLVLITMFIAVRALVSPERFAFRAYGWLGENARRDLNALNEQLPRDAVIGVSDQMAGATMLYAQRDIFRPNSFLEPTREFPQFLQTVKSENRAVFLLGEWNCSPLANLSEKLPNWLATFSFAQTGTLISDLPYECPQILYQFNGE